MFENLDIWKLLAGLGIFIFGMFLMEESIKKLSGRAFKKMIRKYTNGRLKAIFSGMFVTAILQSSSAVSLMILAFVGASIMTMENAIGVILGSNLGTTATGWIVATIGFKINIESFALPLIGSGGLGLIFFGQSEKYSNISKLLVGFGFLFMGLDYMKLSVEGLTANFDINTLPNYGPLVYLLIGILLTAVMQSSSATMAIVLTGLNAGILSFNAAAAMIIGANVGTTFTILLGAIGGVQAKKRVAYSHFAFNMITGILAMLLLPLLTSLIINVFKMGDNLVMGLALFHTIFNLLGVLVFLPFVSLFARLLVRFFPDKKTSLTEFINNATADIPDAAIASLKKETVLLLKKVLVHNLLVLRIDEKLLFPNYHTHPSLKQEQGSKSQVAYEGLKLLQSEIFTFASAIQAHELSEVESSDLNRYLHIARVALHAAKNFKDIQHDFDAFENDDNQFLNEQYTHFRKRLMETYWNIDKLLGETDLKQKPKLIINLMNQLKQEDRNFVQLTMQAIQTKQIEATNVATALLVNRVFVQSSRQILTAVRDIVFSQEELKLLEDSNELLLLELE